MIFPTWTPITIAFYLFWGVYAFAFGFIDHYGTQTIGYSKFASGKGLPSRVGMVTVYAVPLLVVTLCALPYLSHATIIQSTVYAALTFHFAKRVLESLFLHKYSGTMDFAAVGVICFAYLFQAGLISWLNATPAIEVGALFYAGLFFFVVGQVGNFYHHWLLANLRKNGTGYQIPRGGWFEYVTCPHYFFELLAWLGIALLSLHLFAALTVVAMMGYLTSRSMKTRQWYRTRFEDYPATRKLLIPYLF